MVCRGVTLNDCSISPDAKIHCGDSKRLRCELSTALFLDNSNPRNPRHFGQRQAAGGTNQFPKWEPAGKLNSPQAPQGKSVSKSHRYEQLARNLCAATVAFLTGAKSLDRILRRVPKGSKLNPLFYEMAEWVAARISDPSKLTQ